MAGGVHGRIDIGEDVLIGPGALLTAANYRTQCEGPYRDRGMEERDVIVSRNVWIGAGAIVLPGVRIGEGAIIAAGTVVHQEVPPGAIHAGAAPKVILRD